jgi:MerR family transcriptional regulator, mercuric resistance operon regulatory protein
MPHCYSIGKLAAAADVHVETIRYYQRRKLIPEPVRPIGGMRRYTQADVERLRFIKRAQAMGFTLDEIESLLRLQTRRSCRATQALATKKLQAIDERIHELRELRQELAGLIAGCKDNVEDSTCPVIERLAS